MARLRSRISRVLMVGPLCPFAEAYRRELMGRGYTERTAVNQTRDGGRKSLWLKVSGLGIEELDRARVEEFLAWQRGEGRDRSQWSRPGLLCLLDVLGELGLVPSGRPERAPTPAEVVLDEFGRYLLAERGLAAGTARGYMDHAQRFLAGLPEGMDLAGISTRNVTEARLAASAAVS